MATNDIRPHLLAYDISDPRRLYRVARISGQWGLRVQYSIFILWIRPSEQYQLLEQLDEVIDSKADDVRLYPLPQKSDWTHFGRTPLSVGATLYAHGKQAVGKQELADIRKNIEPPLQASDLKGK
jgi:CRISPR-associated protein Cas2